MKIKVGFTAELEPDLVSKGIMWWLGTNYSHVFFILNEHIYHCDGEGVNRIKLEDYKVTHKLVSEFEVELFMTEKEFEAYMTGANGKEYSESQYLGFLHARFQKWVGNGDKKMICSELVAEVLAKYGKFFLPKPADFMSPKDVHELLSKDRIYGE